MQVDKDATVFSVPPAGAAGERAASPRQEAQAGALFCPVRGVQDGATLQLSSATASILLSRLRVAFPVLGVALAVASVRQALMAPVGAIVPGASALLLAMLAALLWASERPGLRMLRVVELTGFGALLVGVIANQVVLLVSAASAADAQAFQMWLNRAPIAYVLLMLAYGIFIPNTWRRAAIVVCMIGAAPLVVAEAVHLLHGPVATLMPSGARLEYASFVLLGLGAAGAFVVLGTRAMEGYRRGQADAEEAGMYRLHGKLGAGGMGEVWRAEHRLLARPAAIKMIRPDLVAGADERARQATERFRREARATAALESPHTVQLYDFGITRDGTFFYVMEFLDGFDLQAMVERFGPLPPARAIYLLRQAAASLQEAHARGMVHRDIKPANLHVGCRAGHHDWLRVLDFGLVRSLEPDGDAVGLTREGTTTGTPAFFPPEMARGGGAADARSDVYALGAVGFWLLTGQLLFPAAGPMDMIIRHVRDQPDRPSVRSGAAVPAELDDLILRCLAKSPADRPQSMRQLLAALDAITLPHTWDEQRAAEWWSLHAANQQASTA